MTLLLTLLLKSLLLFAVSGLLLFALRRSSAAARSLVCLLTLGATLALPLCSAVLPGWQVLPSPALSSQPVGAPLAVPSSPSMPSPSGTPATSPLASRVSSSGKESAEGAANSAPTPVISAPPLLGAGGPLLLFFLLGLLLASVRPLLGLWGIHRLSRECITVTDPQTLTLAADCAHLLGLKMPPRLCVAAAVPVPMTWGWRRPVVVLPPLSAEWPEDRLRSVLLHEMAHIKRRDWPAHRFADLACAAYWFHPLVWLTARRLRVETELACDDLVLSSGIPASDYARHLLEIASALPRVPGRSYPAIAMAQTSKIESRLQMILDKTRPRRPLARRVLAFTLVPASAALVTLAVLRPDAKAQTASAKTRTVSAQATTPDQVPLLFSWGDKSSTQLAFKPGAGTMFEARPDSNLMTSTVPAKKGTASEGTPLFAGVTAEKGTVGKWWDGSGIPLSKPLYEAKFDHPLRVVRTTFVGATGLRNLIFAFRLPQDAQDVATVFKAPDSIIFSSNGLWPGKMQGQENVTEAVLNKSTGGMRTLEVLYPNSVAKAAIQVGIASGPWKVAASVAATGSGMTTNFINNNSANNGFILSRALETKEGLSLTVSTDSTDDVRIVAVDMQGHQVLPKSIDGQNINKLDQITAQFNLPLSQVKEFRVETRPFHWVEYKDVALRPVQ